MTPEQEAKLAPDASIAQCLDEALIEPQVEKRASGRRESEPATLRAVYRASYGGLTVFVKVYAAPQKAAFGALSWNMTGSLCDANGDTVPGKVHRDEHKCGLQSDANNTTVAATLDASAHFVVARVFTAAWHEHHGADVLL